MSTHPPSMPTVDYFLSTAAHPIDTSHPLWDRPLPETRQGQAAAARPTDDTSDTVSYGRYFAAVHRFCQADGWRRMVRAVSRRLARPVLASELRHMSIYLEKHGAIYHPARLQVTVQESPIQFVVNVAVSPAGRQTLPVEVRALQRLNHERPFGWLPTIYDCDAAAPPLFLADWFADFHEFHLTRPPGSEETAVVVWDGAPSPTLLSTDQKTDVYRQAAMILTACYDPISSSQIHPWHHAAGDFVVRIDPARLAVRLITVRGYAPLAADGSGAPDTERAILDLLTSFFIHLTLRMRLDRIDGVGDVAWAPPASLAPTVQGFFQGLDLTARLNDFPQDFPETFRCYFNQIGPTALTVMARRITQSVFRRGGEEHTVTLRYLSDHLMLLGRIMHRQSGAGPLPG